MGACEARPVEGDAPEGYFDPDDDELIVQRNPQLNDKVAALDNELKASMSNQELPKNSENPPDYKPKQQRGSMDIHDADLVFEKARVSFADRDSFNYANMDVNQFQGHAGIASSVAAEREKVRRRFHPSSL